MTASQHHQSQARFANAKELVRQLAAYLLLPNAAFWILGLFAHLTRPLINVDYLLYGTVASFAPRWPAIAGFCLLLLNDAVFTLAPVFHFRLDTALASLPYLFALGSGFLPFAAVLAVSIVTVATVTRHVSLRRPSRVITASLVLVTLAIVAADVRFGTSGLHPRDLTRRNLATSAAYATARELRYVWTIQRMTRSSKPPPSMSSGAARVLNALDSVGSGQQSTNILLVLVESMGSFRDSTLDSALIAPLVASVVGERYEIRLGTVTSRGATTSGELRELCAVEADYLQIGTLDLNHCMPLLAKQRGYTTMAIHAFSGGFYGRHQWYPRLGFDSIWFIEEVIHRRDLRMCGTGFYGARDIDVARLVRDELQASSPTHPRLIYWLTLNAHLPIDPTCLDGRINDCDRLGLAQYPDAVCALAQLHRAVASAVATIALDPTLRPMRIVLVGDHPPPFLSRGSRGAFAEDRVPFVELVPRSGQWRDAPPNSGPDLPLGQPTSTDGSVIVERGRQPR